MYMNCFRPSSRALHGTPEMKDDVFVISSTSISILVDSTWACAPLNIILR